MNFYTWIPTGTQQQYVGYTDKSNQKANLFN